MSQPTTDNIGIQTAFIALGSNVTSHFGPPMGAVTTAISRLSDDSSTVVKTSRFYETPAFPAGSGPNFVNAVIAIQTALKPLPLLETLHAVEQKMGRVRHTRWAARNIDIDLIGYGDLVLPDLQTFAAWRDLPLAQQMEQAPDDLILPHPRLQDRAFVLGPLCDIAPDWVHPVLHRSAAQMLAACPQADRDALKPLSDGG